MIYGWVGKILFINLSKREVSEKSSLPYVKEYIGGRMLAARLAWEFIPPNTGPFDSDNVIIITTGPLCGTIAPTSGRTVMAMISPVPYPNPWYAHSTIGGWFATQLKCAGYDALLISGQSSKPVFIEINDDVIVFHDAGDLWGKDTITTQKQIKKRIDPKSQVMTIGPAGENLVNWATVQHDFDSAAGHSGFGAVWGSKKIKAIVARGTGHISVSKPDALMAEWRRVGKYTVTPEHVFVRYNDDVSQQTLSKEPVGPICSQSCVNNCRAGQYLKTEDGSEFGTFCIGHVFTKELPTKYTRAGTDVSVPKTKQYPYDDSVKLMALFNSLGIDFWMRITLQPWLTAIKNKGIEQLAGYSIRPDDPVWFRKFVKNVANCEGLGKLFSQGLSRTIDTFKEKLPEELIRLGKQQVSFFGFQAHREGRFWDNTPLPFWIISAMMYASESRDPTIGSHALMLLSEIQFALKDQVRNKFRLLAKKVWNDEKALDPDYDYGHKVPLAIWSQRNHMLIDSFPLCDFAFPRLIKPFASLSEWLADDNICGDLDVDRRLLNAVTGENYSRESLNKASDKAFNIERCLLARSGRNRKLEERIAAHFNLPNRDDGSRISLDEFKQMMDAYFSERGWNLEDGWPNKSTLYELELEDVAMELEMLRAAIEAADNLSTN